jgi:uncharacterized membrane protein
MRVSRAAPLHPILVHFTVALVGASFAFDIIGRAVSVWSLAAAGWWTLAAAVPLTAGTIVSGLMSRRRAPIAEGEALRYLRFHSALGPTVFGLLIAAAFWRATFWGSGRYPSVAYLVAFALLVALLTVQGYLGGELVYAFGVEVQDRFKRLPVRRP